MADIAVQASFNSGEWSPTLYARVDIQKYKSGAALLENFFVDYRGGASSRAGSKYIIRCHDTTHPVRLIPFQAAFNVGYILECGQNYIRFIYQGSPVVENPIAITGATQANPCVLDIPGNTYLVNDMIYVAGVGGMTQLNGRYYVITNVAGNFITIESLFAIPVDSTSYGAYTSGGTAARVYKITSPYLGTDLEILKFAQSTTSMVLCHPSYPPELLTLITATNWTIGPITFGTTISAPTGVSIFSGLPPINIFTTPPDPGQTFYTYAVTSIDGNGQESSLSTPATIGPRVDIRTYPGSNSISWNSAIGAVGYNVYEAEISYFGAAPPGAQFGFIGVSKGNSFTDSNIGADFSQTPPVHMNPFVGEGISFVTVTAPGTYTTVPGVTFTGGTPSIIASAVAQLGVTATPTVTAGGSGYNVGDTINFGNSLLLTVTGVSSGAVTSWAIINPGAILSGSVPSNPIAQITTSGIGSGATTSATWGVLAIPVITNGAGYSSTPTVVFSAGAATATATLSPTGNGNPSVPGFFDQRLVLAGAPGAPQTMNLSRPGSYFNFDIHDPIQADDAITATLVANTLNSIRSIVSVSAGMLVFTDKASWVVNGGGYGTGVSPTTIVAIAQSWVGASDVPPIIANYSVLYPSATGSAIREMTYNIYFQVFSGTDISIYASHLFYGYTITEWTWAEQPFYEVWMVRNDGILLGLTFLKEQEFVGFSHHKTLGTYTSVASTVEPTATAGVVNAVYTVVERVVNGQTWKLIERFAERTFPNGLADAWVVDSGLQYIGSPATTFQGGEHLGGQTIVGLADGVAIAPFVMPSSGMFTLPTPASKVTIGIAYTFDLQTLGLDVGEPSAQGKPKKIPYVDVRVNQTLNLSIGSDFAHLVPMKDTIQGNVSSMLTGQGTQLVSGLYSGDARTFLDPTYTIPGQYCIRGQSPYPASILGVFPAYTIGDDR